MGSSWTRGQTRVPCIGRWILNHCATREAQGIFFILRVKDLKDQGIEWVIDGDIDVTKIIIGVEVERKTVSLVPRSL